MYRKKKALEENGKFPRQQQSTPQPQEESIEETEQEEEPETATDEEKEEWEKELEESDFKERKEKILETIEAQLKAEQDTDELTLWIKSNKDLETLVRTFLGCIKTLGKYKDPQKATIIIKKKNERLFFNFKLVDENGEDVMFDPKTGNVAKIN
jgi:hypothetical protein